MMIVRDIWGGVRGHFGARFDEWAMIFPTALMSAGFYVSPDMFTRSSSFRYLMAWGGEERWSTYFAVCCALRFVALTINGTFRRFRYSPHIRLGVSILCMFFWSQFALGFGMSFAEGTGGFTILPAYITLCIFEGKNILRAAGDIRVHHDEKRTEKWARSRNTQSRR